MEDRRRERGVGAAGGEDVDEVVEAAGAARRNHRDRHGGRHGGGQRAVEARLGAVAVDGGQQDLAGAAVFGLAGPVDGVAPGGGLAAAGVDREQVAAGRLALRVDRHDDRLAAVALGDRRDERRIGERRGVQADLVCAGVDGRGRVGLGADAAADRERDEQLPRDPRDRVRQRAPRFDRRGNVENDQLVDPVGVIAPRQLRRIARRAQPLEVDAFHDLSIADVEARDDAFREHR